MFITIIFEHLVQKILLVAGETENLETECRPYVEKALKEQHEHEHEHLELPLSDSSDSQEATEAPDDGSASTEAEQQPDSSETNEDVVSPKYDIPNHFSYLVGNFRSKEKILKKLKKL